MRVSVGVILSAYGWVRCECVVECSVHQCVCGVRVGICGGCAHLSVCRGSGSRMVRCVAECV